MSLFVVPFVVGLGGSMGELGMIGWLRRHGRGGKGVAEEFEIVDGVERLYSTDEIEKRPRYKFDINPADTELVEISAWYRLPDKSDGIRCGLSNCHTRHWRGLVVRTRDGAETNIGRDCGKRHFGDFSALKKDFDRRERAQRYRERLNGTLARASQIRARVDRLKDEGANWLYRSLRNLRTQVSTTLYRDLEKRAERGADRVFSVRERSQQEVEDMRLIDPTASAAALRYEEVEIGRLSGLKIFLTDIRRLLIDDVQRKLEELENLDRSLSPEKLKSWYDWAGYVEEYFTQAELLIVDGRRFFSAENFELLRYAYTDDPQIARALNQYEWNFETGEPRRAKRRR